MSSHHQVFEKGKYLFLLEVKAVIEQVRLQNPAFFSTKKNFIDLNSLCIISYAHSLWMIFGDSFQITKSKYCLFSFKYKADVSENVLDIPK